MRIREFAASLAVFLALQTASLGNVDIREFHNFDRLTRTLFKTVRYIHQRSSQMNIDATFGVTMAEANVAATLFHENVKYLNVKYASILTSILELCDSTRRELLNMIIPKNDNVKLLHAVLNNPELWIKRISWRYANTSETLTSDFQLSHENIANLMMQGTPKENESDDCLHEIVNSKLRGVCFIPDRCIEMLKRKDNSRGYPLAHRLLIVQVIRALDCQDKSVIKFSELTSSYCHDILRDFTSIKMAGFPAVARDLAMEQAFLCGSEGFRDFVDKRYNDLLLSWAHPSGCFSLLRSYNHGRPRRTSVITDFGCDSHTTGLGAALLSLLIRQEIENVKT